MDFAAEPVAGGGRGGSDGSGGSGGGSGGNDADGGTSFVAFNVGSVQTGDTGNLMLWSALSLAAGLFLMIYALICFRKERGGEDHE